MGWKETFIEDYAGPPLRVALNLFTVGCGGVLAGHFLFDAPLSPALTVGAMLPPLVGIFVAGYLKAQEPPRRR